MRIAIGSDEAGFGLKSIIASELERLGHEVADLGVFDESPSLYPDTAVRVAEAVKTGDCERGVLICGTGIGMAMTANKVPGIRAAQAHDTYSAERAVKSNDAQIIALGARVIGAELAKSIVKTFVESVFSPGPSSPKIARMMEYERDYRNRGE